MKDIMAAAGFKAAQVENDRPDSSVGHTKFNFRELWNFALDGSNGFSTVPLRVWIYAFCIIAETKRRPLFLVGALHMP